MPTESLTIDGPAGPIEALLDLPATDAGAACAVICHPHPLFGGTMTNKVVHTVARACNALGVPALRFNFRGAGRSAGQHDHGIGETDDALAVVEFARSRWPGRPLWLAGFSFGAYVALRAQATAAPAALVTVAPPAGRWDFSDVRTPRCPWLIVQGDADEVVDPAKVFEWVAAQQPAPRLIRLAGAGHFFHGRLHELRDAVAEFLAESAAAAATEGTSHAANGQ